MVKIQCPNCQHQGTVPDDKVPAAGISVNCPKCKTKFQITPPLNNNPKQAESFICPKCGAGQQVSDTCINCGLIFSKYTNRQPDQNLTAKKPPLSKQTNITQNVSDPVPNNTNDGEQAEVLDTLINCTACNNKISKNASSCPICGEPNKVNKTNIYSHLLRYKYWYICFITVILIGLYAANKGILSKLYNKKSKSVTAQSDSNKIKLEPSFLGSEVYVVSPNGRALVLISSSLSQFVSSLKIDVVNKEWMNEGNMWTLKIKYRENYTGITKDAKFIFGQGLPDITEHQYDAILGAIVIDGTKIGALEVFKYVGNFAHITPSLNGQPLDPALMQR